MVTVWHDFTYVCWYAQLSQPAQGLDEVAISVAQNDCESPADPGNCLGYFPRWFFNVKTGYCDLFIYGGCGGNGNNYLTQKKCELSCPSRCPVFFTVTESESSRSFWSGLHTIWWPPSSSPTPFSSAKQQKTASRPLSTGRGVLQTGRRSIFLL